MEVVIWHQATVVIGGFEELMTLPSLLRKATEDLKNFRERMGGQAQGDSQQDGAAVDRT